MQRQTVSSRGAIPPVNYQRVLAGIDAYREDLNDAIAKLNTLEASIVRGNRDQALWYSVPRSDALRSSDELLDYALEQYLI